MNKTQLIDAVTKGSDLKKKEVEELVEVLFNTIMEKIAEGEKVQVTGFGTFERKIRKERKIKIPNSKREMVVPQTSSPSFSAGSIFKEKVANK